MMPHIFLAAIFYATVLSTSGQILKGNADTNASSLPPPKMSSTNIVDEYQTVCNRSLIDANKDACGSKMSPPTNVTRHRVDEQNQVLLETLIHSYIRPEEMPEFQPIHGFKLLNQTLSIYKKVCADIPATFIDRIALLFRMLHYRFASTRSEFFKDVGNDTKWIETILDKCMTEIQPMHFLMDPCKEMILGGKGVSLSFICTNMEEEANFKLYDPILDIVWFMINGIRAACFKFFHGSYRMWHHYFLALQDTFAPTVQLRWNSQLEHKKYWQALLGPFFPFRLADVEKCTKSLVDNSELGRFNITFSRGQFIPYSRLMGSE